MDEKLKILLGSEDIISRDNEDIFLSINLQRTFNEYKLEKYDNEFDLAKQFQKERNLSRDFIIYGIVDSNVIDLDNYNIYVYSNPELTDLIQVVTTTGLSFDGNVNLFNKKRGKYFIKLENYQGTSIYFKFLSNNFNISEQVYEQKLVFFESDGEFIEYGTETVEIDNDLNSVDVNNNFPFFYNKHWVKKNIDIQETKQAEIQFDIASQTINEGSETQIVIELDKPSPFGNEKVNLVFNPNLSNSEPGSFSLYENTPSNILSNNQLLSFNLGEQTKTITFKSNSDFSIELFENYVFTLENFSNVKTGETLTHSIKIMETSPRRYAKFVLSNMFENRFAFQARRATPTQDASTYTIFRNGLFYLGSSEEFYPIDDFDIKIKNNGVRTALLENSGFNTGAEQIWESQEEKTFTITPRYSNNILNEVVLYFPPSLNDLDIPGFFNGFNAVQNRIKYIIENIYINGFQMNYIIGSVNTPALGGFFTSNFESYSYKAFKQLVDDGPLDIYKRRDFPKPFTIIADDINNTITLVAKSPGVRLDVQGIAFPKPGHNQLDITIKTPYSYPNQLPFEFTLLGNSQSNSIADYTFSFIKKNHKVLTVNSPATASFNTTTNYLITSYNKTMYNWDVENNLPIAFSGNPIQQGFSPNNRYYLPLGKVFYEGLSLLSISDPYKYWITNLTEYSDSFWSTNNLNKIPETYTEKSTSTRKQKGLMKIITDNLYTGRNSFDYKNLNTEEIINFSWVGARNGLTLTNQSYNSQHQASPVIINSSNFPDVYRSSNGIGNELDDGGEFVSKFYSSNGESLNYTDTVNIPIGIVDITNPSYTTNSDSFFGNLIYVPYNPTNINNDNISELPIGSQDTILIESKDAGVGFEINNITKANPENVLSFMPILYNEIENITLNKYNNRMGGYSL